MASSSTPGACGAISPARFWGVHGMSVDQEGNVYTAAVDSGGAQKFTPRKGANPAFLLGKQVNPGWK